MILPQIVQTRLSATRLRTIVTSNVIMANQGKQTLPGQLVRFPKRDARAKEILGGALARQGLVAKHTDTKAPRSSGPRELVPERQIVNNTNDPQDNLTCPDPYPYWLEQKRQ